MPPPPANPDPLLDKALKATEAPPEKARLAITAAVVEVTIAGAAAATSTLCSWNDTGGGAIGSGNGGGLGGGGDGARIWAFVINTDVVAKMVIVLSNHSRDICAGEVASTLAAAARTWASMSSPCAKMRVKATSTLPHHTLTPTSTASVNCCIVILRIERAKLSRSSEAQSSFAVALKVTAPK